MAISRSLPLPYLRVSRVCSMLPGNVVHIIALPDNVVHIVALPDNVVHIIALPDNVVHIIALPGNVVLLICASRDGYEAPLER